MPIEQPPATFDDPAVQGFADRLFACLAQADDVAALLAFQPEAEQAGALPRVDVMYGGGNPHPLAGLAALLVSKAMLKAGKPDGVLPFLGKLTSCMYDAGRNPTPDDCLRAFVMQFGYLWIPLMETAIVRNELVEAACMLVYFEQQARSGKPQWMREEPAHCMLENDTRAWPFGPFFYDAAWALDLQEIIEARDAERPVLDRRREIIRKYEALFLQNALVCGQPGRALPLLDARLASYLESPVADEDHFGFNASCVLAALNRFDEALKVARAQARRGYHQLWRYNLPVAEGMAWTQAMRQNECLGPLAETEAYQAFLREEVIPEQREADCKALCHAEDSVLGGKAKKRCFVSRRFIHPGQEIVRMRELFGQRAADRLEIASKDAFLDSPWAAARAQLENNAMPLAVLFPPPKLFPRSLDSPAIAAFWHDVGHDPASLDLDWAARLIADHAPPPIRHEWVKGAGRGDRELAFPPFAGDDGHGDAANLVWRLVKAGHAQALLERFSALPEAKADKVYAMLATFGFDTLRQAAADHFGLPDLPAMMETAFKSRPTLPDHLALADFGARHTRFRKGMAAAMRDYALHLYSNYHPGVDWYLQGLQHYALAGGCQLLYFLIHHPEDDTVLAAMLEKGWLPHSVSTGAFDAYGNSRPFFVRVAAMHLALHAPERLDGFLERDWVGRWCGMAKDRETFRLIKTLRKKGKRK